MVTVAAVGVGGWAWDFCETRWFAATQAIRGRPGTRLIRTMRQGSPGSAAVLLAMVMVGGVLSLLFVISLAAMVVGLPPAVDGGARSSDAHHVYWLVAALTAIFCGQQTISALLPVAANKVGRELDGHLTDRMLKLVDSPEDLAHLHDPAIVAESTRPPRSARTTALVWRPRAWVRCR